MQNNIPGKTNDQAYAGFFVRIAAYLIDWLIVGTALLVIRIPFWIASLSGATEFAVKDFIFSYSIYDIFLYVLKVGYFVLLTYYTGATIGKKLLQIRVVSEEDRKPTLFEILFRETIGKFLSKLILYVGYFIIGGDKYKRGLHDILSDTRVIYYHQKAVVIPTPVYYNTAQYQYGQVPNTSQQQSEMNGQQPNPYQTPGSLQSMQDIESRYRQPSQGFVQSEYGQQSSSAMQMQGDAQTASNQATQSEENQSLQSEALQSETQKSEKQ